MPKIKTDSFSLGHTLECGQAFRWDKKNGWWYGVIGNFVIKVKQEGNYLTYESSRNVRKELIKNYFGLNHDLKGIASSFNKDVLLERAIKQFYGLRIIKQDFSECLLSFICSSASNIPKIKKNIENLSKSFGKKIVFDGMVFYTFPKPEAIAKADLGKIKRCGVGFRAKYLKEAAKTVEKASKSSNIKESLLSMHGVGEKIANCVLLFSLGELNAFPVDVWIKRVMEEGYGCKGDPTKFGQEKFGEYAGYAGQYLYHYSRTAKFL